MSLYLVSKIKARQLFNSVFFLLLYGLVWLIETLANNTDDNHRWIELGTFLFWSLKLGHGFAITITLYLSFMYSNTYEKVQENSDRVWKFKRYDVISEYNDRPALCPPLIVLAHLYYGFLSLVFLCKCCRKYANQSKFGTLSKFFIFHISCILNQSISYLSWISR